ncbi:calpastatin [Bordetella genomosp. 8]|uniref:Calpastatin n=1 Tax=Bordetella genomosp. 8 TaxID=1416806 RepID=A0A1W6YV02_9BORD|nr:calpastatin [Bordetella genomosp. 8]
MNDAYGLDRFVLAQDPVFDTVCQELAQGRKRSHWIWFVFPQIRGLGRSEMAQRYGISCLDEARAYVRHPVLGQRLKHACELVARAPEGSAAEIFGPLDAVKFRSSLTLFTWAAPEEEIFRQCLDRFFGGQADPLTLSRL